MLTIWIFLIYFDLLSKYIPFISIFSPAIKNLFSLLCHQESNKVFTLDNHSTFVCFRCLGLYWGALFTSSLLFAFRNLYIQANKTIFFISLILIALDVVLVKLNVYNYNIYITFLTGFLLGFICFLYLYKSIFEQLSNKKNIDE